MTLVNCPERGKEISERTILCPLGADGEETIL